MRSYKYPLRSFKVVCGGETPEARHDRVQTAIMDAEQKRINRERFDDTLILRGSAEEKLEQALYAIKTYEQDLSMYRRHTKELEQKIRQLEIQLKK